MARAEKSVSTPTNVSQEGFGECFVIMPISDPGDYPPGHFARVYEDIFKPAIRRAGYEPKRADDVLETNLIQLDLLRRLLEAPMAVCDLSSRNPNVLFELGLRQAFDKPVVIVQEEGTPRIFDISPLRFTTYRKARIYHEVLADQEAISEAIAATRKAVGDPKNVNSLVRLLGLTEPASIAELKDTERDPAVQLVRAEIAELRREVRSAIHPFRGISSSVVDLDIAAGPSPRTTGGIFISLLGDNAEIQRFVSEFSQATGTSAYVEPTIPDLEFAGEFPTFIGFSDDVKLSTVARGVIHAAQALQLPSIPRYRANW